MAAHLNELYTPFRRYHIGKAYRGENTQRGRYREFVQCDFDIVGVDSASADADILLTVVEAFKALGIEHIELRVAHRGLFSRFLGHLGAGEQSAEVLRTVDKLRKVGVETTRSELAALVGDEKADRVVEFVSASGEYEEVVGRLEELAGGPGIDSDRVRRTLGAVVEAGAGENIIYDPTITRGLDYYTGIVFETFLPELPDIGSVCSGGRYNDLASLYTKQELPGVGGSVGLDRLLAALEQLERTPEAGPAADVLVFCLDDSLAGWYHSLARAFRNGGLTCEVYPETKKLAQQFGYAEKKGIPLAVISGPDEHAEGRINCKDLRSRESFDAAGVDDAVRMLRSRLGAE